METLTTFINKYFSRPSLPTTITLTDVVEIFIIAFLAYQILVWIKNTKAWFLLKGILFILAFTLVATIFEMNTILWIVEKLTYIAVTGVVVVFQPELRKALEQLGRKNLLTSLFSIELQKKVDERFSDRTLNEIVKGVFEMAKVKTGALIVIKQELSLTEYERTGIALDALISSQLLINIFEHNTPLHDGAIIVKGDRVVSATCYLPLSDNMGLSKELGTRHRAAVGISEATDAVTVIVSEETGRVSLASRGSLYRNLDAEELTKKLTEAQNKRYEEKKFRLWKGRVKDEEKTGK